MAPLSPQAADFVQYGNTRESYFTGGVDLKIPLYTYKDNDLELPVRTLRRLMRIKVIQERQVI